MHHGMFVAAAALFMAMHPYFVPAVAAQTPSRVRNLAPGVLTVIPSEPKTEETFQGPIALTDVTNLDWEPPFEAKSNTLHEMAKNTVLRRNVWNLEFAFKPLRMVPVDIPQPTGKMQRKLIWYMVYRVQNNGQHLTPVPVEDEFKHRVYETKPATEVLNYGAMAPSATLRFFPHFVLKSHEYDKSYLDRVIPVAMPVIQQREMRGPSPRIYNSVEITRVPIPPSTETEEHSVWGVVIWEDVDPRIDFLSIYVQGLTNAFRLVTDESETKFQSKTLQMTFWRPGDAVFEHEGEIRFGVPAKADPAEQARILEIYGLEHRLDYQWIYR